MVRINDEAINIKTGEIDMSKVEVTLTLRNELLDLMLLDKSNSFSVSKIQSELLKLIKYKIAQKKDELFEFIEENDEISKAVVNDVQSLKKLEEQINYNILELTIKDLFVGKLISTRDFRRNNGVYDYVDSIINGK